jgi:hypothetical protein
LSLIHFIYFAATRKCSWILLHALVMLRQCWHLTDVYVMPQPTHWSP